jgi:hypothetical protein
MSQMLKHATEQPAPLASLLSEVPTGLQQVLDRMMAKSPDERFATPIEAADALARFVGIGGTAVKPAILIPEFKAWLETESQLEMPNTLPSTQARVSSPNQREMGRALAQGASTKPIQGLSSQPKPTPSDTGEINVELVSDSPRGSAALPSPKSPRPRVDTASDERGLLELDRRDWIMLAVGAASVLVAVGAGYGLARLVRKKPEDPTSQS